MKALKEKRLSLLSLWRRGLIILSLLALVFASCNKTTDPVGPGEVDPNSGKIPVKLTMLNGPSATDIYEGLLVDLTGAKFMVNYLDTSVGYITDPRTVSVYPTYYDSRINSSGEYDVYGDGSLMVPVPYGYTVSYKEGGRIVSCLLTDDDGVNTTEAWEVLTSNPTKVHPLIRMVYTGQLLKQEYNVDDIPDFKGVVIEGRYGSLPTDETLGADSDKPGTDADVIQMQIPVNQEYPWRWVWNQVFDGSTGAPGGGTGFAEQKPGILLSLGKWGNTDFGETGIAEGDDLIGMKIPVAKIYQVANLEFVTPPTWSNKRAIFFDDPTLIGRNVVSKNWMEFFDDVVLRVNYEKGCPTPSKEFTAKELETIGIWNGLWGDRDFMGKTYGNQGGSLTIDFVNSKGIRYQDTSGAAPPYYIPMVPYIPLAPLANPEEDPVGGVPVAQCADARDPLSATNDYEWEDWAKQKEPKIRFQYRDKYIDTVVPIYNKLTSITFESDSGELIVLNGADKVYSGPETIYSLVNYATMKATYTGNAATAEGAPGVREDVFADIKDGYINGTIDFGFWDPADLTTAANNFASKGKELKVSPILRVWGANGAQTEKKASITIGLENF